MSKTNTLSLLSLSTLQNMLENKQTKKAEIDPLFSSIVLSARNDKARKKLWFWLGFLCTVAFVTLSGIGAYLVLSKKDTTSLVALVPVFVVVLGTIHYKFLLKKFKTQTGNEFEIEIMSGIPSSVTEKEITLALTEKIKLLLTTRGEETPGRKRVVENVIGVLRNIKSLDNKGIILKELNRYYHYSVLGKFLADLQIQHTKEEREVTKKEERFYPVHSQLN